MTCLTVIWLVSGALELGAEERVWHFASVHMQVEFAMIYIQSKSFLNAVVINLQRFIWQMVIYLPFCKTGWNIGQLSDVGWGRRTTAAVCSGSVFFITALPTSM